MLNKPAKFFIAIALIALVSSQAEAFHLLGRSSSSTNEQKTMCFSSKKDEDGEGFERKTMNPLRLAVLRLGLTEPAWTSPLNYGEKDGVFTCAYCGHELFDSTGKFDSGSGWPSFWRSKEENAIDYKMEFDGRLECRCGKCKSHLGHVFLDGPRPETVPQEFLGESPASDPRSKREGARLPRFCVNGACLNLNERN